ncbi:MAG: hypothetical protein IPO62_10295 [Saprospiraceae bacterium]|nr:hypothetical protein [Saprospiraceae bacterium]
MLQKFATHVSSFKFNYLLALIPLMGYCQTEKQNSKYLKSVGDIAFDSLMDQKEFFLCNEKDIMQYHNNSRGLEYRGEKLAIIESFEKKYVPIPDSSQNGLIRVRFVVNCKGQTDRFRIIAMDEDYQTKKFDERITQQILDICKSLDGWLPKKKEDKEFDYYQYLIFKIQSGQITEILP